MCSEVTPPTPSASLHSTCSDPACAEPPKRSPPCCSGGAGATHLGQIVCQPRFAAPLRLDCRPLPLQLAMRGLLTHCRSCELPLLPLSSVLQGLYARAQGSGSCRKRCLRFHSLDKLALERSDVALQRAPLL